MHLTWTSLLCAALVAVGSAPAPVTARYSWVYDEKHRQLLPNCPAMAEVRSQTNHAIKLWERDGAALLARIRTAVAVDSFPAEPIVIYLIGCGRGISDPLTVSVYGGGPDGPFLPRSDEEILREVAHELLHRVAGSAEYAGVQRRLDARYPHIEVIARNHILVAALEARVYGYAYVRETYVIPEYTRAVRLAVEEGLIPGVRIFR